PWYEIPVRKNPPARSAPTGQSTTSIWCSAGIRGPASPNNSSSPRITVMVTDARTELPGFEERFADVRGCRLRYLLAGEAERMAIRRPDLVRALILAGAAGISSGARSARYALTVTGLVKPGKRIAPYRAAVARSAALKTLVFGRWGASDPPALPEEMARAFLS